MTNNICTRCKSENEDDALYCSECGEPLHDGEQIIENTATEGQFVPLIKTDYGIPVEKYTYDEAKKQNKPLLFKSKYVTSEELKRLKRERNAYTHIVLSGAALILFGITGFIVSISPSVSFIYTLLFGGLIYTGIAYIKYKNWARITLLAIGALGIFEVLFGIIVQVSRDYVGIHYAVSEALDRILRDPVFFVSILWVSTVRKTVKNIFAYEASLRKLRTDEIKPTQNL